MNATAEDASEPETSLHAGQVLDRKYRVDYLVGQGGMAAVWAGTNERTGKRVALKVLLRSFSARPGMESLLQREVLAASRVDHPNVVTVFDVIEHQGVPCIVMELLAGETLDRHLARVGKLSASEAYGLLVPAMRGVDAAHAQGVIHSDLKPQNIFICVGPDGRPVTTKVLDFGISLVVERSLDSAEGKDKGMVMGTPAYMAPEQFSTTPPIDRRADVYGFGVLFYEALSGQVPFPGKPGPDLYRRILTQPAPPLAQHRPDLDLNFVRIIDTALAKDRTLRHPCLDAMIGALDDEFMPETPPPVAVSNSADSAFWARNMPGQAGAQNPPGEKRGSTQVLVNFPRKTDIGRRDSETRAAVNDSVPRTGGNATRRLHHMGQAVRGAISSVVHPTRARAWQGLAGVGIAGVIAGIVFLLWPASGTSSKGPATLSALPAQPAPATHPKPSGPQDPGIVATMPAPPVQHEATPSRPVGLGTVANTAQAEPATPVLTASGTVDIEAKAETRTGTPSARNYRAASRAVAQEKIAVQRASAQPASSGSPRAGNLSAEDF